MSKRAVTYARVSGDDRGNDRRNLAGQLDMCREYAHAHDYELIAELAEDDRGASGASFELEQLNSVRDMARDRMFDVLVVREIDRLSRNLAKQLIVEEELKRDGVQIEYVLGEYPDTPEGNLMKHVRASIAEFEREKIKERMVRGRMQKFKSGKLVGNCIPFGYKRIGKAQDTEIVIDKVEAEIVQQIFNWFVYEKASMRQIALWLTEKQVPNPGRKFNKPSNGWTSAAPKRILSNPSYIGKFSYGEQDRDFPDLAIVSEDVFRIAQDILNKNRKWEGRRGRKPTKARYLLLDHFFCSCGYRMTGRVIGRRERPYYYYKCVTGSYPPHKNPCREIMVRGDMVDEIVWEWLKSLLSMDEGNLQEGLNQMAQDRESQAQHKRSRFEAIEAQVKSVEKKIFGLMQAFDGDEDEIVVAALRERVDALKRTKAELLTQREAVNTELSQILLSPNQIDSIVTFAQQVQKKMNGATYENKLELIKLLNVRVDLVHEGDEYRIDMSCDIPDSDYAKVIRQKKT